MPRKMRFVTMILAGLVLLSAIPAIAQRKAPVSVRPLEAEGINEWSSVANDDNPYDEVGRQHNQLLAAFVKSEEFKDLIKSGRPNDSLVIRSLSKFCCRFGYICCKGIPGPFGEPRPEEMIKIIRTSKTHSEMLGRLNLSKSVQRYALQIEASLKPSVSGRTDERSSFNQLVALEKKVARDRTLAEADRAMILKMAATVRHSKPFWQGVSNDPTSPLGPGGTARKKIDWGEVGFVDGLGGLFGAWFGAIASVIDVIVQCAE